MSVISLSCHAPGKVGGNHHSECIVEGSLPVKLILPGGDAIMDNHHHILRTIDVELEARILAIAFQGNSDQMSLVLQWRSACACAIFLDVVYSPSVSPSPTNTPPPTLPTSSKSSVVDAIVGGAVGGVMGGVMGSVCSGFFYSGLGGEIIRMSSVQKHVP